MTSHLPPDDHDWDWLDDIAAWLKDGPTIPIAAAIVAGSAALVIISAIIRHIL